MITMDSLEAQLKKVNFNINGWGRTEAKELVNILYDHEELHDLVNGYYDGGFALLVATNIRIILVDKKPLNYLTVEDIRFDMISEIDYSHRLIGAHVNVSTTSNKILKFTSLNQQRLRKTIGHVQHLMAMSKKNETEHAVDQKGHLAQINQQLQTYLLAQHQQQQALKEQLDAVREGQKAPEEIKIETIKPSHELSDYLFAQSLLAQAKETHPELQVPVANSLATEIIHTAAMFAPDPVPAPLPPFSEQVSTQMDDLYEEGMKEVFGTTKPDEPVKHNSLQPDELSERANKYGKLLFFPITGGTEVNPFRVVASMFPLVYKSRRSFVTGSMPRNYEALPSMATPVI